MFSVYQTFYDHNKKYDIVPLRMEICQELSYNFAVGKNA